MVITECISKTKGFIKEVLGQYCRILTVLKVEDKWKVICEVLVDPDYTTRRGLGDIVEIYEVYLDNNLEVLGYELTATKGRLEIED
jgi:hypothetical protein